MNTSILKLAEKKVHELYASQGSDNLLYHSEAHAAKVVDRINEIAGHYQLSDLQVVALNLAGWFHDVGHLQSTPSEHEQKSVEIAKEWMKENGLGDDLIDMVKQMILATKLETSPQNTLDQIIKDADTYNFGTKEFKKTDKLLKEEMRLRNFTTLLANWKENKINTLQNHQYYTDYARRTLEEAKLKNIEKARQKAESKNWENTETTMLSTDYKETSKESGKKNSFITKGIQTMLRLNSENHMRLSEMADSKANILISVNAIIISLILSILIRKIEVDTHLTIPTFMFLITSVVTIVLAIIATRPKVTTGKFTHEDVIHGKTNLLFFGNFFKANLDEYKWGMSMMMRDPNYLYGGLVDDIYHLGVVLGRKYRLLSIAYNVFMIGIIVTVIAFVLAIFLNGSVSQSPIQNPTGSPF